MLTSITALGGSALARPVVEGILHPTSNRCRVALGKLPRLKRSLPRLDNRLPRLKSSLPRLETRLPLLTSRLPRLKSSLPRLERSLPRLARSLPRLSKRLPRLARALPRLSKRLPRLKTTTRGVTSTRCCGQRRKRLARALTQGSFQIGPPVRRLHLHELASYRVSTPVR